MLLSRGCRLDLGEFEPFADDIADLAFDCFQHPRERCAQRLFHLHHFKGQYRCAFLQGRPNFSQQRNYRAWQRRDDLVLTNLFIVIAAERIDPMQIEAAVARPKIKLHALR